MTQFPGRTVGVALALGVVAARSSAQEPVAEARALLKTIVEINSTHERGSTTPIARLLAGRFTAAGFPVADVQVLGPGPRKQNLVVRWRAAASTQKPILFISHLDVVEAKREDWATDPFKFVEKDGYYYARGIWDDAERYLGQAIANYVTLLNPELLVLGGGVMTTVPGLAPALERQVRAQATVLSRDVRVALAGLGDSSAIFGVADRVWGHG